MSWGLGTAYAESVCLQSREVPASSRLLGNLLPGDSYYRHETHHHHEIVSVAPLCPIAIGPIA
jgi:hypothetical protein